MANQTYTKADLKKISGLFGKAKEQSSEGGFAEGDYDAKIVSAKIENNNRLQVRIEFEVVAGDKDLIGEKSQYVYGVNNEQALGFFMKLLRKCGIETPQNEEELVKAVAQLEGRVVKITVRSKDGFDNCYINRLISVKGGKSKAKDEDEDEEETDEDDEDEEVEEEEEDEDEEEEEDEPEPAPKKKGKKEEVLPIKHPLAVGQRVAFERQSMPYEGSITKVLKKTEHYQVDCGGQEPVAIGWAKISKLLPPKPPEEKDEDDEEEEDDAERTYPEQADLDKAKAKQLAKLMTDFGIDAAKLKQAQHVAAVKLVVAIMEGDELDSEEDVIRATAKAMGLAVKKAMSSGEVETLIEAELQRRAEE